MTDLFTQLVHQLGQSLGLTLHVDHHHACALNINNQMIVQIQLDAAQEKLLIASSLTELPPGRFRENVLSEALKTNNLPDPRTGILGFLPTTNRLTMHQRYPLSLLDGQKISSYVASFIEYAKLWKEAIEQGETSPAPIAGETRQSPFGFKK